MTPNKLTLGSIDTPNHPDFDAIYDCYSKVFTLESERESRENFEAILDRNKAPKAIADKSKEMWIYLKNEDGKVVGAANFDAFAGSKTEGYDGSVHAIYVFVDPAYRKQGIFTRLNDEMQQAACDYVKQVIPNAPEKPNVPIIAEQNAPFRMTPEEYLADNEAAGIDQVVRRQVFEKEKYHTLDCRYIQPPLSEEQGACTYLDAVIRPGTDKANSVPSSFIKEHFDRFFSLSFPPGTTRQHPDLTEMNESLEAPHIKMLPAGRFDGLGKHLNAKAMENLPEEHKETPVSDLFPTLHRGFTGQKAVKSHPRVNSEQGIGRGQTPQDYAS